VDPRLAPVAERLPIFPLARTVLMPGALLPLHVFEPRYRALLAHCVGSHGLMGIATLDLGRPASTPTRPPLFPEIGVGAVVSHQPLPDGRSNIVLQYVGRGILEEELPTEALFREVRCRFEEPDADGFGRAVTSLEQLVLQLGTLLPAASAEARKLVDLEPMELVDALARRAFGSTEEQRRYLSAARLVDRVAMVEEYLATFLLSVSPTATD
jgi:Lon protease-like protein